MLNARHRCATLTVSALACLAALPLVARAQATPAFLNGSAAFSNVSVTLVDLDPNDGIAPGLTLNGAKGFLNINPRDTTDFTTVTPSYQGSLLPGSPTAGFDLHSLATATPDGMTQSASKSFAQALEGARLIPQANGGTIIEDLSVSRLSLLGSVNPANGEPLPATFSLTPHTALVIEGQSDLTRTLDTTELREWAAANGYQGYNLGDRTFVQSFAFFLPADVSIFDFDLGAGAENSPGSIFLHTLEGGMNLLTLEDPEVTAWSDSRSFSIRFDNTGDTDLSGQFAMSAAVFGDATVAVTKSTTVVPEPGAFALMGLGLVGLAGLSRSRRRKG